MIPRTISSIKKHDDGRRTIYYTNGSKKNINSKGNNINNNNSTTILPRQFASSAAAPALSSAAAQPAPGLGLRTEDITGFTTTQQMGPPVPGKKQKSYREYTKYRDDKPHINPRLRGQLARFAETVYNNGSFEIENMGNVEGGGKRKSRRRRQSKRKRSKRTRRH